MMKKIMKNFRKTNNNGITLIALVITIIVLLILAAVSIATLTGQNGILTRAKDAKVETRGAEVEEIVELWKTENKMSEYSNSNDTPKSEDELLQELLDNKQIFEEEIDRENQTITIDDKIIYYGEGKPLTDIFVALYNDGTLVFNSKDEFDTSKIVENGYFGNVKGEHYYYDWDIYEGVTPPWTENEYRSQIAQVEFVNEIVPKYTSCWFYNCENITSLDLSNLDTSNVTDMSMMFVSCFGLPNLDLSNFDTNAVQNYSNMFLNDINTQVYIGSNWNSAMTETATNYSKNFIKK